MDLPFCHDLYFLLYVLPALWREIDYWRAPAPVGTPVKANMLHVTVGMIGQNYPKTPHHDIDHVISRLAGRVFPSCTLIFDTLVCAEGRALLTPSEPLPGFNVLQAEIAAAIGPMPMSQWRMKPHITLGHDGQSAQTQPIDPISWTADTICLVESFRGRRRHFTHASWQLTPRTPPAV